MADPFGAFGTGSSESAGTVLPRRYRVGLNTAYRPKTPERFPSPESLTQSLFTAGAGAAAGGIGRAASMAAFGPGQSSGIGQVPVSQAFIDFDPENASESGFEGVSGFERIPWRDIPDRAANFSGFQWDRFPEGSYPTGAPNFASSQNIPGGGGSRTGVLNIRPPASTGFETVNPFTGRTLRHDSSRENLTRYGKRLFVEHGGLPGGPGPRYFPGSEEGMYAALAELLQQGYTDLPLSAMGENPVPGWARESLEKYGEVRNGGRSIPGTYRVTA